VIKKTYTELNNLVIA